MWLAFLCATLFVGYFGYKKYTQHTMNAMRCEKRTADEFEKSLARQFSTRFYAPKPGEKSAPVTLNFNFSPAQLKDAVLVIFSNRSSSIVYRDVYKGPFVIQAGEDLQRDGGFDDLEIFVFNKATLETCAAAHESAPVWQANRTIHFKLLPAREIDKSSGRPVSFEIRAE
jgi:hypothetical protein